MDLARNLFRGFGDDIDDTAHGVSPYTVEAPPLTISI